MNQTHVEITKEMNYIIIISDSINTKRHYSCHDRISWAAESAEAGTWDGCNRGGRDKERRLLVKRGV